MTDARQVVARQMTLSGETLLLALEPLDDDEFFRENGNGFSAAWVTGHLACVADLFSSWFDGGKLLSPAFHQVFNNTAVTGDGPASKAASVNRALYPKADLLLFFRQASVKALRTLGKSGIAQWDAPPPASVPVTLLTGGAIWERLAVHSYWHCGELAGSIPRFYGTYALNILPHHLYVPAEQAAACVPASPAEIRGHNGDILRFAAPQQENAVSVMLALLDGSYAEPPLADGTVEIREGGHHAAFISADGVLI